MILRNVFLSRTKVSRPRFNVLTDRPVQSGLGVTPSQMLELTKRGVPISPANLGLTYQEGVSRLDFTPPLEYQRGIDIGALWEARQDSREKFRKAYSAVLENQKGGE